MLKFRTEIDVRPFERKLGYDDRWLLLGSCFADAMRERLRSRKFRAEGNFAGPLFNPLSIADAMLAAQELRPVTPAQLHRGADGTWFHYGVDTRADGPDPAAAAAYADRAQRQLHEALERCDVATITFGTAWIYRLRETGQVVANCHRQPQRLFERQLLTVGQIVERWAELLGGVLASKQIVLTVSPVRHLGDGAEQNSLSKALLRVAAAELEARFDNVRYFPAFELLTDDLRDYRFYADDLVHPSPQAVEYIWEKFAQAALTPHTRQVEASVLEIVNAASHRPLQPRSEAYRAHCRRFLGRALELTRREGIDFSEEIARFEAVLSV